MATERAARRSEEHDELAVGHIQALRLTIRYIPTSTRITTEEQPFPSALHLRGAAGVNRYQLRPTYAPGDSFAFRGAGDPIRTTAR